MARLPRLAPLAVAAAVLVDAASAGAVSQAYRLLPGSTVAIGAGAPQDATGSMTLEALCDRIVEGACVFEGNARYAVTQLRIETDTRRLEASGPFPSLEAPDGAGLELARSVEVEPLVAADGSPLPVASYGFDPEPTGAPEVFSVWTLAGVEDPTGEPLSRARGFDTAPFRDELLLDLDLHELIVELTDPGLAFPGGGETGSASLHFVVPEPGPASLLVLGLAVLAGARRT